MSPETKLRWKLWKINHLWWLIRPYQLITCKIVGHKVICYKVVPTDPQEWFTICHRCADMGPTELESCGRCTNGCN